MFKTIGKYIGIGVLVGIGISITDYVYFEGVKKERIAFMEETAEDILNLRDLFHVEGLDSIYTTSKEYDPGVGLNFSLENYKIVDDLVVVSGTITNTGTKIWKGMFVEVEVRNGNGQLIAECDENAADIKPGHWEAVIMHCPMEYDFVGKDLREVSFKIKKAFHDKTIINKNT